MFIEVNFLADLIELVARIWHTDSEMRDRSLFGESEMEKRSRRTVRWVCGSMILALLVMWIALCWLSR